MEKEHLQELIDIATDAEALKLKTLHQGVIDNLKKYRSAYSTTNLKAWQASEKALVAYTIELQAKYNGDQATLANVKAVIDYLRDQDRWQFSNQTVYNHQKAGKFSPQADGFFLVKDILIYAEKNLSPQSDSSNLQQTTDDRKKTADAEYKEYKLKILKSEYIPVSDHIATVSALLKACKTDFENFHHAMAPAQVAKVMGREDLVPDLLDFNLKHLEKMWLRWKTNVDIEKEKYGAA